MSKDDNATAKEMFLTPTLLAERARAAGTAILEGEPCAKCREPQAIFYYTRHKDNGEGLRPNGCLWCRHLDGKNATTKEHFLSSAVMIDDSGNAIYEGRACKICKGRMRFVERPYGASNKGSCISCPLHQHQEKEHGKQIKRASQRATAKLHKFVIQSIERSGAVEVAPRSLVEYLELKDLVHRCELMNQRETALITGIRWELGHKYPAAPDTGTLRGKATIENVYLVQQEQNRRDGNTLPDEWTFKQVVSVAGCRAVQNSYEAAKAWIEARTWDKKLTPAEKKARTIAERKAWEDHAERVRKVAAEAVGVLEFFATTNQHFLTFEAMRQQVETRWNKVSLKMDRVITAAIQSGRKDTKYAEIRELRLTADAFCGAQSRLWLVVMTFQQLADAIEIICNTDKSPQTAEQVETVKRCVVLWAMDVLDDPAVLVMGFTHPLLSVLGKAWTWGTSENEATGQEWLCVWQNPTSDELTSFDGDKPPEDEINPALLAKEHALTPELIHNYGDGWQSTAIDYLYEQQKDKARREALAEKRRQQEVEQEASQQEQRVLLAHRIEHEARATLEGIEPLYWFAASEWEGQNLDYAHSLIAEVMERARNRQDRIRACVTLEELNSLLVSTDYESRQWRQTENVFRELLQPF